MTAPLTGARRRLLSADLVITLVLLALFAAGLAGASQWSIRAALFPRFVMGLGMALAVLHLVAILLGRDSAAPDPVAAPSQQKEVPAAAFQQDGHSEADDEADAEVEYVFSHASGAQWARSLGWVAAFFVSLYLLGLYVAAPAFAFGYLVLSAKRSLRFGLIYAAVTLAVLYLALEYALETSTPTGVLF